MFGFEIFLHSYLTVIMSPLKFTSKVFMIATLCSMPLFVVAKGGISVSGTRIIYPKDSKQQIISVRNSSETDSFLVQSWVENTGREKESEFIVTPPLFLSSPGNENKLRLVFTGRDVLPDDKETLYYFVNKAIPSVSNDDSTSSVVRISAASRVKFFVRPDGLSPSSFEAPQKLSVRKNLINSKSIIPHHTTLRLVA
jgi:fimbrial chaperone protein